jgi:uncharacterized protein (UPF0332 family)
MISIEVHRQIRHAEESREAAHLLLDEGHGLFSAMWSYHTMQCLLDALLLSKGLEISKPSARVAAYVREFSKPDLLDPKFHHYLLEVKKRHDIAHYGLNKPVSDEDALTSYQWTDEFMQAVKKYLNI